ncbi:uncharacterized protein LOC132281029 [Cornus florida]|uniref:uncharacterized protein LOC132281029 n=1 Tax=Cornus florida TaxID=4283 RepID=UPI00289F367A|nr:uncharacterized protein LOC132281029 [Cornus florida]
MDDPDTIRDKGPFVRVMAEVEVKESLPKAMVVDIYGTNCDVSFEYEWKPVVCKLCSRVDHTKDNCPKKVLQSKPRKTLDRWVVKQKKKVVEGEIVDKITDNIPVKDLQTNNTIFTKNSFALLEDNEAVAQELENVTSLVMEEVQEVDGVDMEKDDSSVVPNSVYDEDLQEDADSRDVDTTYLTPVKVKVEHQCKTTEKELENVILLDDITLGGGKQSRKRNKPVTPLSNRVTRGKNVGSGSLSQPFESLGDWNIVPFNSEKKGGLRIPQSRLDEFNSVIYDLKMDDIPINNGDWSWCNKQNLSSRIDAKLDRVLTNELWLQQYSDTKAYFTPTSLSDHYGLRINWHLNCSEGPKPFKFLKIWCM